MYHVPVIFLPHHFWKMQPHQQGLGFTWPPEDPGGLPEDVSGVCREGAVQRRVLVSSPSLCLTGQALSLFCLSPSDVPLFWGGWT